MNVFKKGLGLLLVLSIVASTLVFGSTFAKGVASSEKIIWDFEDLTVQGWEAETPTDMNVEVGTIGKTNALKFDHVYKDKDAQTWWDRAGVKCTAQHDLSAYKEVVFDVILDPSAIDGYGSMSCTVNVFTEGWGEYVALPATEIYYTAKEVGESQYVKVKCRSAIPDDIGVIEQVAIGVVAGSVDYSKNIYIDNIGFSTEKVEIDDAGKFLLNEKSPVEKYGKLSVNGTNLCDENGDPVQLRGISYAMMMNNPDQVTRASMQSFLYDWKCDIVRLSIDLGQDYYYTGTDEDREYICKAIDYATEVGLYVLLDWHVLNPGNPNDAIYAGAEEFFEYFSNKYADATNIIYEICNEPNGSNGTWNRDVKPYAENIISIIRKNSPDSVAVVGTPTWSQDVDQAANNPIKEKNVMYTLHFYSGSHTQALRDKAEYAMDKGIAIFVTEWGNTSHTGADGLFFDESDVWLDFMDEHKLSWTNWAFSNSSGESSILKTMVKTSTEDGLTVKTKVSLIPQKVSSEGYRYWSVDELSLSGAYVREATRNAYVKEENIDFSVDAVVNATSNSITVNASTVGESGTVSYTYYILKDGQVKYIQQKTTNTQINYHFNLSGDYTVAVYATDASLNTVSFIKDIKI